jgi:outer membrane murein-binding lipoprotein Lpp
MKRQRVPYARRSAWTVIAILAAVIVAGFVAAGLEIHHLQTEVDGLQNQVTGLNTQIHQLTQLIEALAKRGK